MPFKSLSLAKALLALSIGIGLTSAYFGRQWTEQGAALSASVNKSQKQERDAQAARNELAEALKADAQPMMLEQSVSALMLEVFNKRVEHGVTVAYATPAKLSGGSSISRLDTLSEDIPGTRVKSVRVNVSGTYATYQGLLDYLKGLQSLPVAIVRLKVQDQSFEVALRAYGNQ